jgi:hypothetical protein
VDGDDSQLLDNRVSGAGEDGFDIGATDCLLLQNRAKSSASFDLFDDSGNGNTYVDNDFGTTHLE